MRFLVSEARSRNRKASTSSVADGESWKVVMATSEELSARFILEIIAGPTIAVEVGVSIWWTVEPLSATARGNEGRVQASMSNGWFSATAESCEDEL